MTTAGLQIFNDNDVLQIDQNYRAMLLQTKASVTLSTDTTTYAPATVYTTTITYTGVSPIIAWNGPTTICLWRVTNSGTSWTFYLVAFDTSAPTIIYYIFDDAKHFTPTDNFGLEIFDASGQVGFHSSYKPLRVVGAMTIADPTKTLGTKMPITNTTFTTTAGTTYAIAQANLFYRSEAYLLGRGSGIPPAGETWYEARMIRGSGSADNSSSPSSVGGAAAVVWTINEWGASDGSSNGITQWGQLAWLVLDVTNY